MVVVSTPLEWDPHRCGSVFPRLLEVRDVVGSRYAIDCPDLDYRKTFVGRVRRPHPVERAAAVIAYGLIGLTWFILILAVAGIVVRDPLRLGQRRRELAEIASAQAVRRTGSSSAHDGLPILAPLVCSSCRSPVPLADSAQVACRHCDQLVDVPEHYRETGRLRRRAQLAVDRAGRLWRLHGWLAAPEVRWVLVALCLLWLPVIGTAALYGLVIGILRGWYMLFAVSYFFAGFVLWLVAWRIIGSLRAERQGVAGGARLDLALPPVELRDGGPCSTCGAPLQAFSAADIVLECAYCGSEHLLHRRLRRAHAVASARAGLATTNLLEATTLLEQRTSAVWRGMVRGAQAVVGGILVWLIGTATCAGAFGMW